MQTRPKIALFQCQWCLYSKPDQQWVDNELPPSMHLIKLQCTGRINPLHILNDPRWGGRHHDQQLFAEKCHSRRKLNL